VCYGGADEAKHMREIVIDETLDDMDKNKDGFVELNEYLSELWAWLVLRCVWWNCWCRWNQPLSDPSYIVGWPLLNTARVPLVPRWAGDSGPARGGLRYLPI